MERKKLYTLKLEFVNNAVNLYGYALKKDSYFHEISFTDINEAYKALVKNIKRPCVIKVELYDGDIIPICFDEIARKTGCDLAGVLHEEEE